MKTHLLKSSYLFLFMLMMISSACETTNIHPKSETTPVVAFDWAGEQSAPATITFTNNTLYATNYYWDFGNGTSSTKQFPPAVIYTQPGSYDIVLTAGNSDHSITIKKTIAIGAKPVALFSYTYKNNKVIAPATVDFINESTNADTYEWDINGKSYITVNPSNVLFNYAGDYSVKLVAIKGNIRSAVYESTVTVAENTDPLARFTFAYHPYPYTVGEEIQIVNRSVNSDAWTWTFGPNGPAPSTDQHPVVKFATPGMYPITLVAKKGNKTSAHVTITLKIN